MYLVLSIEYIDPFTTVAYTSLNKYLVDISLFQCEMQIIKDLFADTSQ